MIVYCIIFRTKITELRFKCHLEYSFHKVSWLLVLKGLLRRRPFLLF